MRERGAGRKNEGERRGDYKGRKGEENEQRKGRESRGGGRGEGRGREGLEIESRSGVKREETRGKRER